jgi:glutathione S-transferase
MYTLRMSPASPYARKVRMTLAAFGLQNQIAMQATDTNDLADSLHSQNPLGRIPVLITPEGLCLYDSRVILDHLERLANQRLFPASGATRDAALTRAALAEGVIDSAIAWVYAERFAGDQPPSTVWRDRQQHKIRQALDHLEQEVLRWPAPSEGLGAPIALACALGYLSFRAITPWQTNRPRLTAWYQEVAIALPGFADTAPV